MELLAKNWCAKLVSRQANPKTAINFSSFLFVNALVWLTLFLYIDAQLERTMFTVSLFLFLGLLHFERTGFITLIKEQQAEDTATARTN